MEIIDSNGAPTRQLFIFLKYNVMKDIDSFSPLDEPIYQEFCKMWGNLIDNLKNNISPATLLGSIASMFGFRRHYCSTCGQPIIGRFSKIGTMITCETCHTSFKIVQELEQEKKIKKTKKGASKYAK